MWLCCVPEPSSSVPTACLGCSNKERTQGRVPTCLRMKTNIRDLYKSLIRIPSGTSSHGNLDKIIVSIDTNSHLLFTRCGSFCLSLTQLYMKNKNVTKAIAGSQPREKPCCPQKMEGWQHSAGTLQVLVWQFSLKGLYHKTVSDNRFCPRPPAGRVNYFLHFHKGHEQKMNMAAEVKM